MKRHRKTRRRRSRRSSKKRQRGGMQSPIKIGEFGGVPLVDKRQQAVVFRSVDPTDPHGASTASMYIDDVARNYGPFVADV